MLDDVQAVMDFNATRLGQAAVRSLRACVQRIWPDLSGQRVLALGFAGPLLSLWRDQALSCVDAVTSPMPVAGLERSPNRCIVQDDALPFPDNTFDRVVMMHAIENADATRLLRGVWRCLRDDGRLLVVVPNRTGLWAIHDGTPFADGAPCSVGRIERLLRRSLFRIEHLQGGLFMPPVSSRLLRRAAPAIEAVGRRVSPRLAGVLVVEAVKDIHAAAPTARAARALAGVLPRRMLVPLARDADAGTRAGQAFIATPYCSSTSR